MKNTKNTLGFIMLIYLSSFVGASCFNESAPSEDLEIGSQLIDVLVCNSIEVKENIGSILPVFYFIFVIILSFFAILTLIFLFRVLLK